MSVLLKYGPIVSVIVPVYNPGEFLHECLTSLIKQTHLKLDIVLVDDGSTDGSGELLDEYAKKDKRIRVFHTENKGASEAKNIGILNSFGSLITFIDSDDYIRLDFIENLVATMKEYNSVICTTPTDFELSFKNNTPIPRVYETKTAYEKLYYGTLEKSVNGVQMFSTQLIKENSIKFNPNIKIGEDFDFFARAMIYTKNIAVDFRKMYYYRKNPNSVMNRRINKERINSINYFNELGMEILKNYPSIKPAVDSKKFSDSVALTIKACENKKLWLRDLNKFKKNITQLKWRVLANKEVRIKTRLAALLYCILGYDLGTLIIRGIRK